jgi:iron complex outermembrane recepter protein
VLDGGATLTVQGDVYDGDQSALVRGDFTLGTLPEANIPATVDVSGHNLLARWERPLEPGASFRVQAYYDHTRRDIPGSFDERRYTGDLEVFHDVRDMGRHDVTWGAGWRVTGDDVDNTRFATFDPDSRTDHTFNAFLQDQISFRDGRLRLTVGTKLEHNDYSGFEHQPNVRLAWLPTPSQTLWGAVSRAVRVPARLNEDLELFAPIDVPGVPVPFYVNVQGRFSADVAVFYNDYDRLMTNEVQSGPVLEPGPPPYLVLPIVQGNGMRGETWGGTVDLKWQPTASWRLELQLTHIDFDLEPRPRSGDSNAPNVAGNSPKYQAALFSHLELPRGVSLFTGLRYVDELPNQDVPSYVALDASVQWQIDEQFALSLTVRDLNDPRHPEFGRGREIERSALLSLSWRF